MEATRRKKIVARKTKLEILGQSALNCENIVCQNGAMAGRSVAIIIVWDAKFDNGILVHAGRMKNESTSAE
jgi:hypothetical protein